MWSYALLGTVSLVAATYDTPSNTNDRNQSLHAVSSSPLPQQLVAAATASSFNIAQAHDNQKSESINPPSHIPIYPETEVAYAADATKTSEGQDQAYPVVTHTPVEPSTNASPDSNLRSSSISKDVKSLTWESSCSSTSSSVSKYAPSKAPFPYANSTTATLDSTVTRGPCTGCAIAALNPSTAVYQSNLFGNWTSLVVTETILTEFVTYLDGSTIDTIVTESKTINQTKIVNGITDTAANFNIYLPTPGLLLTLEVGPTYVIYTDLVGGPDAQAKATAPNNATHSKFRRSRSTCQPQVSSLRNWAPTQAEDWDFFIQTFNGTAPEQTTTDTPLPVPTKLAAFLANDPNLQAQFQGADIATCTLARISEILKGDPHRTINPPAAPSAPADVSVEPPATGTKTKTTGFSSRPPVFSSIPGTNTFLSTTYASTSKHITKQGCLRCDTNPGDLPKNPKPTEQDSTTQKGIDDATPTPSPNPKDDGTPKSPHKPVSDDKPKSEKSSKHDGKPQGQPQSTPKPDITTRRSVTDIINSIISDNPVLTKTTKEWPTRPGQTITIGNSEVAVKAQPTRQSQGGPIQQTVVLTVVIIGTRTVTLGQTTTINGIPVIVPTAGRGSKIIVDDKTIDLDPRITQAPLPVITVGHNTITANPQGNFVVGTQTLQLGGPELTVNGNTLTLGPNGKIAIWNGATQTLVTMVGPTGAPVVKFGGQPITAKVIGGTTVFVLDGKTLAPGSAVTVGGTTFSLPRGFHGSSVVINGESQRLDAGLPTLTINNSPIVATVVDGTTEFVLAPGATLTPGGELIISGTTYSLPTSGAGSTVIIDGATSRLNPSHLPVLSLTDEAVTATIAHGTTAFVFGPDVTLVPGGVVTVSGTTLSLPASASGSVVVINGVTSTLASDSDMGPVTPAPPIVVDGKTVTATTRDGTTEYVLNSATTLKTDGQIIIDGTTYSLAPDGTALVVNGKTSSPASNSASTTSSGSSSETTSERGAGDFIASGIGESSKGMGSWTHGGGADKWVESLVMGLAGWMMWMF